LSELKRSRLDLDVMKTQAEATNMEYDRLMKEHSQLQVRCCGTTQVYSYSLFYVSACSKLIFFWIF